MISIIGAGPAGGYSAYLLAKAGLDVNLYEEHFKVGEPVACTGIVTKTFLDIFPKSDVVINKIKTIRIFSPAGHSVDFNFKEPDLILDRAALDREIALKAEKAGAKINLGHRFESMKKIHGNWALELLDKKTETKKKVESEIVIGADGPKSNVAQSAGLYGKREFFFGVQATVNVQNENIVEVFLLKKGFGWLVPESENVARVGVAASEQSANLMFQDLLKRRIGENYREKITGYQAGLIPFYQANMKAHKDNVYLVGDSATMTKAASAGGILQSLYGAMSIKEAIVDSKNYEKQWKSRMGKDLYYSLLIRRVLDKFSDKDYDSLVKMFNSPKLKELMEKYERDFPTKFAAKLFLKEPRLLYFAKFLI